MRYKNIVFVIHESIKNLGNFKNYLIENTEYLITFHFPHGYLQKFCYFEIYKKGKLVKKNYFPKYKVGNIIKLFFYYIYFYYTILKFGKRESFVIVENPIFCLFNSIVSFFKKTKFVFWVGDYFPDNSGFMWFYNRLADYYNKNLNFVIYVSPPVFEIYKKRVIQRKRGQFQKIISLGMRRKIERKKLLKGRIILGFIGVIREQQGLDLVFKFIKNKNYLLEIIGDGYSLSHYKNLAKKLQIEKKIIFHGFVEDPSSIFKRWNIGLALYENKASNVSKYCEPVKIKDYLENDLPVITTRTTYIYKELEKYNAGEVVEENVKSLGRAITKIGENYKLYQRGVKLMLEKYEYKKWYKNSFKFLET